MEPLRRAVPARSQWQPGRVERATPPTATSRRKNMMVMLHVGDEIERRAEAEFHFKFGERFYALKAEFAFDVVSKDEGELLAIRPPGPVFRRALGTRQDRPLARHPGTYACNEPTSRGQSNRQGDEGFQPKVKPVTKHEIGVTLEREVRSRVRPSRERRSGFC